MTFSAIILKMKPKMLVFADNQDIIDHININLESEYTLPIIYTSNIKDALLNVKSDKISMIISQYELENNLGSDLYALLKKIKMESTPFILVTERYPSGDKNLTGFLFENSHKNAYIKLPIQNDELVSKVTKILNLKRPSETQGYRRVGKNQVEYLINNEFEIFTMDKSNKYHKLPIAHNDSSIKILEELTSEKDKYLYIENSECERFMKMVNIDLTNKIKSTSIKTTEKLNLQFDSVESIHNSLWELGLTQSEIDMADANINASYDILNKNKQISKILSKFITKNNYSHKLSMMTCYLSSAIFMKTDWFSRTIMMKLSMAAIMMDISLEDEEHVKITKKSDLNKFKPDIQNKILSHPDASITHLNDFKDISSDTRNIILHHHERPHNEGFPKGLKPDKIYPLSCIFILAHEFSHRIIIEPLTRDILQSIVDDFDLHYNDGNFKKPYLAFKNTFKK